MRGLGIGLGCSLDSKSGMCLLAQYCDAAGFANIARFANDSSTSQSTPGAVSEYRRHNASWTAPATIRFSIPAARSVNLGLLSNGRGLDCKLTAAAESGVRRMVAREVQMMLCPWERFIRRVWMVRPPLWRGVSQTTCTCTGSSRYSLRYKGYISLCCALQGPDGHT